MKKLYYIFLISILYSTSLWACTDCKKRLVREKLVTRYATLFGQKKENLICGDIFDGIKAMRLMGDYFFEKVKFPKDFYYQLFKVNSSLRALPSYLYAKFDESKALLTSFDIHLNTGDQSLLVVEMGEIGEQHSLGEINNWYEYGVPIYEDGKVFGEDVSLFMADMQILDQAYPKFTPELIACLKTTLAKEVAQANPAVLKKD